MNENTIQAPAPTSTGHRAVDAAAQSIDDIIAKAVGMPAPKAAKEPEPAPDETPEPDGDTEDSGEQGLDEEPSEIQSSEEKSPAPAQKRGSDELRKARETAKIAGLPETTIKSMSEADLLAFSKAKSKNDADVRRAFQENAELKRQLEEAKKPATTAPAEPQKATPAVEEALDAQLVSELGEQGARALTSLVAKKVAALEARVQSAESKAQAAESKAQEHQARAVFDAMQGSGEFGPGLPEYAQVLEKAMALSAADGLYAGLTGEERARSIFRDATKLVAAPVPSSPEPAEEKPPAKTATVTRVPQRTVRQQPANGSPDAAVDRMIQAALRGERDPDTIARKYG